MRVRLPKSGSIIGKFHDTFREQHTDAVGGRIELAGQAQPGRSREATGNRSREVGDTVRRPWTSYDVTRPPQNRLHTVAHTVHTPTDFAHVSLQMSGIWYLNRYRGPYRYTNECSGQHFDNKIHVVWRGEGGFNVFLSKKYLSRVM